MMIINFRTFSFRNENHASQWPKEAVCGDSPLASPRINDKAMVKQPACAAAINSSGLDSGFLSNRLLKL
jgi:hypothetical protein